MMFKLLDCVNQRLQCLKEDCTGALYGTMASNSMVITSLSVDLPNKNGVESYLEMQSHFPTGIDYCGVFRFSTSCSDVPEYMIEYMKDVQISDNPLLLNVDSMGSIKGSALRDGRLSEVTVSHMTEKEFSELFITLRLQGAITFNLSCDGSLLSNDDSQRKAIFEDAVFHFPGSDIYLFSEEVEDVDPKITLNDLISTSYVSRDPRMKKGLIEVTFLQPLGQGAKTDIASFTLMPNGVGASIRVTSSIDALCITNASRLVEDMYCLLTDTVCRQLQLFEYITENSSNFQNVNLFQQYHFFPLGQFVTLLFPSDTNESDTRPIREELHRRLALPKQMPLFKNGNRLIFLQKDSLNTLMNVHEGLNSSGINGGKVAIVSGLYSYHHYRQDNIDDDGWGCAYRSFQTLFSWYRWQGYTDLEIPSHKEIQECLVKLGDKPKKFIGSKEWIGSAEVGYCLNSWLGISTQVLTFASGGALIDSANDLLKHFEIHGTPIMIGGGALAHTILGIHYNEESHDIKFLVLDPHYPGKEDLKIIQSKGWVGWKGMDFWKKQSFYNMCLPLKPRTI